MVFGSQGPGLYPSKEGSISRLRGLRLTRRRTIGLDLFKGFAGMIRASSFLEVRSKACNFAQVGSGMVELTGRNHTGWEQQRLAAEL